MMKVAVIYDSLTGNTEKMAKAVVEGVMEVKGVEVELMKVGTPFSMSKLNTVNALIFGSPTRYGSVTIEMKAFLDAVKYLVESNKLQLAGKIGGVFGSYGWDGGWVIEKLSTDMKKLGIKIIEPIISAVDGMGTWDAQGSRIDQKSLQKCRKLGKAVAEEIILKT